MATSVYALTVRWPDRHGIGPEADARRNLLKQTQPLARDRGLDIDGTGISGLDDITDGGLAARRLFLVEGAPGSGKTTLALQFLLEGARVGEKGLYITLRKTTKN